MVKDITAPVVYNFFIRPEVSIKVFNEIRKAKPKKLFLISDGPRNSFEKKLVEENRNQIDSLIDWNCSVVRLYCQKNQGMDQIMEMTYELVFSKYDRMIFLEEDLLPNQSFFYFCDELLEKYKDDESIYLISGINFLGKYPDVGPSYFFVDSSSTWGMAIWKRTYATMQKDLSIMDNPYYSQVIRRLMMRRGRFGFYQHLMLKKFSPEKIRLDGEFWLMGFNQNILFNSLNIVPSVSLVKNIGDVSNSEHSDEIKFLPKRMRILSEIISYELEFPLVHPEYKIVDFEYTELKNLRYRPNGKLLSLIIKIERAIRILVFGGYKKFYFKLNLGLNRYWNYSRHKNKFK